METVIRNVGEIDAHDRQALEHVLGQTLRDSQQLVIRVINREVDTETAEPSAPHHSNGVTLLPEWCDVYAGLSDDEIAEMEMTILQRADLGRPFG